MTSYPWRLGITLVFLGLASILPATVGAQPPVYLTQWGSPGSGNGQFRDPFGVATDAAGNVYVADTGNNRIQKFTSTGTYLTQWGSPPGTGDGQFNSPFGVAIDAAGDVYVSDAGNNRIQKFTGTGTYLTQWGLHPDSSGAQFNGPLGVATDAAGNVYVSDQNIRVQKFTSTGTYLTQWGSLGSGDGEFGYFPFGLTTDAAGNVYVSDFGNNRIQKFTGTGTYLTQWGSPGNGNGQFRSPYGVATDAAGDVYVVDFDNNRIQKFTDTGTYLTQWGSPGSGDGQFNSPRGVATDAAGNVYVADQGNQRIQKFGSAVTPTCLQVGFDFEPRQLNLKSNGQWVTGYVRPPAPYRASQIDVGSIRLNEVVVASDAKSLDSDRTLKVKFSRDELKPTLTPGDHVPVTITGMIAGVCFTGTDTIKVKALKIHKPDHDSQLVAGTVTDVIWDADPTETNVSLLSSGDDGVTWRVEVPSMPNTGSYLWSVSRRLASPARLAVESVYASDETGIVSDSEFGVSEAFTISSPLGVDEGARAEFALRGVMPNPAQHELHASFSLGDSKPATLALFDLSGRKFDERRVDGMGPGWHTVTFGEQRSLRPGLYMIRLTQDGRSLTIRAALVR